MRIIFVTPLLWKRLDRAVRRREEGQALVLVALASIAMVAIVGLAVDGGMAYLEAQKLQRAADAASLSGVVWVPTQTLIADGRGKLSANANGYKVYKPQYVAGDDRLITDNYNFNEVMAASANPGQFVSYYAELPKQNQYKVTLGEKAHRYFLGVIGLGDYYIQRASTAEYTQQIKLGSSFNYLGSTGVLYDPSVNANSKNQLYQRYINNRCTQANPPPTCVGTFWSNIGGPDSNHGNGDAYTPIYDGQQLTKPIANRFFPYTVQSGNRITVNCGHSTQPNSWFISDTVNSPSAGLTNSLTVGGGGGFVPAGNCATDSDPSNNPPILNQDIHPDAAGRRNFGYEVGIQIDPKALILPGTTISHTNVNISIYDAAFAVTDASQLFGTGEANVIRPNDWGLRTTGNGSDNAPQHLTVVGGTVPANPGSFNGTPTLIPFYRQGYTASVPGQTYSYPYTGTVVYSGNTGPSGNDMLGFCNKPGNYTGNEYSNNFNLNGGSPRRCLSQFWITDTTQISSNNLNTGVGLNFNAGQNYRFNEMRTRYTLYYPPQAPGISSVYGNVATSAGRVGAFEVGEMSIRYDQFSTPNTGSNPDPQGSAPDTNYMPIERESTASTFLDLVKNPTGNNNAWCYIVSLNPPNPGPGTVLNYTPGPTQQASLPYSFLDIRPWNDTRFVYACPDGRFYDPTTQGVVTTGIKDYYWGMAFPSPQYPYQTSGNVTDVGYDPNGNPSLKTLREKTGVSVVYSSVPTYYATLNAVAGWLPVAANSAQASLYPYLVKPANTGFLDPSQECRISVSSAPGRGNNVEGFGNSSSTIEPLYQYGSPRMPFNAAYGDRINYLPVQDVVNKKFTSYYFSRHGWRCNWDFDSDYDPRFNPLNPGKSSPNEEPLDPPGGSRGSNGLPDGGSPQVVTNNGYSYYGNGKVEPFFHLTDYTWTAPNVVGLKPGVVPGTTNAIVRPGTYMMHVQVYGGSAANRYSLKAEYENAKNVDYTLGTNPVTNQPITTSVVPVPNVYGISTFSIYTNAVNPNNFTSDVLFDLAYIAPENAGSTAILQLWDPGDVTADLDLSILEPSPAGNRLTVTNTVAVGQPITVQVSACPYYLNNIANCRQDPNLQTIVPMSRLTGTKKFGIPEVTKYYNDMWVFMVFQIPNKQAFDQYLINCLANNVPEEACYYFQIDYKLGAKGTGNDVTTWQLVVQGSPVRLLK